LACQRHVRQRRVPRRQPRYRNLLGIRAPAAPGRAQCHSQLLTAPILRAIPAVHRVALLVKDRQIAPLGSQGPVGLAPRLRQIGAELGLRPLVSSRLRALVSRSSRRSCRAPWALLAGRAFRPSWADRALDACRAVCSRFPLRALGACLSLEPCRPLEPPRPLLPWFPRRPGRPLWTRRALWPGRPLDGADILPTALLFIPDIYGIFRRLAHCVGVSSLPLGMSRLQLRQALVAGQNGETAPIRSGRARFPGGALQTLRALSPCRSFWAPRPLGADFPLKPSGPLNPLDSRLSLGAAFASRTCGPHRPFRPLNPLDSLGAFRALGALNPLNSLRTSDVLWPRRRRLLLQLPAQHSPFADNRRHHCPCRALLSRFSRLSRRPSRACFPSYSLYHRHPVSVRHRPVDKLHPVSLRQ
jgi:hypothetical protein